MLQLYYILISNLIILLPEEQAGEVWEPSKKRGCFGYGGAQGRTGLSHVSCYTFNKHITTLCSGDWSANCSLTEFILMLNGCTGLVGIIIFCQLNFLQQAYVRMCNLAYYSDYSNINDVIINYFIWNSFILCKVLNQTDEPLQSKGHCCRNNILLLAGQVNRF